MKKNIFFYCLFLIFSCKKNDVQQYENPNYKPPIYGTIGSFDANGRTLPRLGFDLQVYAIEQWAKTCASPHYSIKVIHRAKTDSLTETIQINGLSYGEVGKMPITYKFPNNYSCDSVPIAYFHMSKGDVGIANYYVLKKSDSFINVESYDLATKEVKGTFNITFLADGTSENSRRIYPDTIRFTGAKFTAKIN